ncbi:MAG: glycine betaine/proline transport system substrate-binding protein [Oceanicoccus sp.]
MIRLIGFILLIGVAVGSWSEPIKIITNNWSSQIVLSHVMGELFKKQGYNVEYLESSIADQWGALSYGVAHVQVEVWEGTMATEFDRLVKAGRILDMGLHNAKTREEWWYPEYVEAHCPGLPDWKALKKCAAYFSQNNSNKGLYLSGPWEKPDEARIRALQIDFEVKMLASGDQLNEALKAAVKDKQPIVLFNWTPNWVESRIKGKFVEFPDYAPECETDPSWGVNKDFLYDCGNPKGGWLKKAAWSGMTTQWPCASKLLKSFTLNSQQIASAAALVDFDELSHAAAAQAWLAQYQTLWQGWIDESCQG